MLRKLSSIFFTIIFLALISAPTIICVVDNSIDISIFYSITEEEEKGHQTIKNVEVITSGFNHFDFLFHSKLKSDTSGYYFKSYPKPHLNLISPPPEQYIL